MQPAASSETMREIGKYQLVAELARGGMGVVYLAITQGPAGFRKLLVVKELRHELATDETYVAMFLDEARLAARLTHKNIVQTLEVGTEDGRPFMVMEHVDGRSLHRVVRRCAERGGLPVGAHLRVIAEALVGLDYAHELQGYGGEPLGIVHRDVSPLNVMVTFDGQVKVLDFGIAKSADSTLETKAGVLKGRIAYMPPEQAWGKPVDRRADVYAAGVMIWEAAARQRLWRGKGDVEILSTILREGAPRLRSVVPDAAPELDELCARAMARDPAERPPTAAALLEELEAHLARRDDAPSMRDVGTMVAAAFADDRRQTAALLEETLAHAHQHPHSGVMPMLEPRARGTPSGRASAGGDPADSVSAWRTDGALPQRSGIAPSAAAQLPEDEPPPAWRSRGGAALGLTGVALGITLAAAIVVSRSESPSAPTEPSPPPPPAGAALVVPDTVDLAVRVSPAGAQILLDGVPLAGNPFHGRVPRDASFHRVSASAEGYEPKTEDVSFAGDLAIDLSLDRHTPPVVRWASPAPAARPSRHGAAAPSAEVDPPPVAAPSPSTPRTEVAPTGGHAPQHPIVTSNPYGNP